MKNRILSLIAVLALSSTALAQDNAITRYFSDFENRDDATSLALSGKAFELAEEIDVSDADPDVKLVSDLASKVDGFNMLYFSEETEAHNTARKAAERVKNDFEELLVVKNGNSLLKIFIDEMDGTVKEVLCIGGQDKNFVIATITGNLNLSEVGQLTQTISRAGSKVMGEMRGSAEDLLVYPNPAPSGQAITIQVPKELQNAPVRIYNGSGVEVASFQAKGKANEFDTRDLAPGVYVVKSSAADTEMSGKFIIR